LRLDTQLEIGK